MEFFLFGLFRDEGRERPTGGLADYRQVKPWKKRGISRRIVRFALNFAKPLKHGREEESEGEKIASSAEIAKKYKLQTG
jgi:hypothetical protein